MLQTLVINTPDTSRANWMAVNRTLRNHGFEVHDYHSRITDTGMFLVARVKHSNTEDAAKGVRRELTAGSTLTILQ